MGDDNGPREQQGEVTPRRQEIYNKTGDQWTNLTQNPTNLEAEFGPLSQQFNNSYGTAVNRNMGDYTGIMQGYQNFQNNTVSPLQQQLASRQAPNFSYNSVSAPRTSGESLAGYRDFAQTGGYSPGDIRDIRARGISPIRAAYGNTMQNLARSRSLGGGGSSGSPNYIAAVSRAQRELPQQLADATQGVNAQLAESIRSGKLAGLQGMTGITEGEAGRGMTADLANQQANIRIQELTEQGKSAQEARQIAAAELGLKGLEGQASLYGTTPGFASMAGNQALQAYQQRSVIEDMRNKYGLGLVDAQLQSLGTQKTPGEPWWKSVLEAGSNIASAKLQ